MKSSRNIYNEDISLIDGTFQFTGNVVAGSLQLTNLANQLTLGPNGGNTVINANGQNNILNLPKITDTLVAQTTADNLQNKVLESNCVLTDSSDITKKLGWNLSGASSNTELTIISSQTTNIGLIVPTLSANDTICTLNSNQTLINKTLSNDTISGTLNVASNTNIGTTSAPLSNLYLNNVNLSKLYPLSGNVITFNGNLNSGSDNSWSIGNSTTRISTVYTVNISSSSALLSVPTTGSTLITDTASQTLSNKTIVNPNFSGASTQSVFSAYSSTATNVTGNGTTYYVVCSNLVSQNGTAYSTSTGVYTAPATGFYLFSFNCFLQGFLTSNNILLAGFKVGTATVTYLDFNPANFSDPNGVIKINYTKILYLTSGTTVQPWIQVNGNSTANITLEDGNTYDDNFSGYQLI